MIPPDKIGIFAIVPESPSSRVCVGFDRWNSDDRGLLSVYIREDRFRRSLNALVFALDHIEDPAAKSAIAQVIQEIS